MGLFCHPIALFKPYLTLPNAFHHNEYEVSFMTRSNLVSAVTFFAGMFKSKRHSYEKRESELSCIKTESQTFMKRQMFTKNRRLIGAKSETLSLPICVGLDFWFTILRVCANLRSKNRRIFSKFWRIASVKITEWLNIFNSKSRRKTTQNTPR